MEDIQRLVYSDRVCCPGVVAEESARQTTSRSSRSDTEYRMSLERWLWCLQNHTWKCGVPRRDWPWPMSYPAHRAQPCGARCSHQASRTPAETWPRYHYLESRLSWQKHRRLWFCEWCRQSWQQLSLQLLIGSCE